MRIGTFFKEHMWAKALTSLSLVILLIISAMITLAIVTQDKMIQKQVNRQGEILIATIEGGMDDALSSGNNDLVRRQFARLKRAIPDIEVGSAISTVSLPFQPIQTL
ncbi:MAG: hypothetical protein ACP5IL_17460 [Syntrophobacteraceae bacterium]